MNIKDDWQVRLCYKRASSRFENGNCDHKKDPFFLENTVDLIDLTFEETIGRFNGFQETIEHFNGFEETIGNFQWFLRRPSPLNVFWQSDHCHQWFFNGFWYCYHRFQWFSMVLDHWSNDAMVSMDRYGLGSADDDGDDDVNLLSKVFFCILKLPSHSVFFGRNFTSLKPILPENIFPPLFLVFLQNPPISRPGKNWPLKSVKFKSH